MPFIDCGSSSSVLFSNLSDENPIVVNLAGVDYAIDWYESLVVPCSGVVSVTASSYAVIPGPLPDLHNDYAFSFLWGFLAAFAFAVASIRRWF